MAVVGLFAIQEVNRPPWGHDALLLPPVFVDAQTGKLVPAKIRFRDLEYFSDALPPWQYYQLKNVDGDTGRLTQEQYEALRQTVLGWSSYEKRLPDWQRVAAHAPTEQAAEQIVSRYWKAEGGWLEHRWTYWLIALVAMPLILYGLGFAVGWVVSGFRKA